MDELIFRGKDRHRTSKSRLFLALLILVVEGALSVTVLGPSWTCALIAGTAVLLAPVVYIASRSWSRVGAAGITVCWGLGRGRTHPWHEIRWIDVRRTEGQSGDVLAARIFLADGRRRALPGLQHSEMYPDPDFDVDFRRVVNWWELSTDEASRVQPPKRPRDRLTPAVAGLLLSVVLTVVVGLVIGVVVVLQGS
ncbi:hypothetical protein [Kitasatospora sp. NBC_00458]|uniref:hypothetical protein n=1 Tax=Kitasatospora sp. NBC_00458 TaxID=2903568 RepID=UPI002E181EF6